LTASKRGFVATLIFNRAEEKQKRRTLRNNAPRAERIIWEKLRKHQIDGARFLRQYSVEKFVLDFYCPEIKLAIEIDGSSHFTDEAKRYDAFRQGCIERFGISFLRFTNAEIYNALDAVVMKIKTTVEERRRVRG
jgi:very-short-patch-repair endonuclease